MGAHGMVAPKFSTCGVGSRILPCARSSITLCSTQANCGLDLSLIRSRKLYLNLGQNFRYHFACFNTFTKIFILCYFDQKNKKNYDTLESMTCKMCPLDPFLTMTLVIASRQHFGGLSKGWCWGFFNQKILANSDISWGLRQHNPIPVLLYRKENMHWIFLRKLC